MKFEQLNIIPPIMKALNEEGYVTPTEIQEQAIPIVLEGQDMLGCAQTGTGKTAAFAVPTLQILSASPKIGPKKIRALAIAPTRELALQIYESFCSYGKYTPLRSCVIYGGVSQKPQETELKKGISILVATPGRLNDLINQNIVDISNVEIFILDEADRMLDMGFLNDVKKIISRIPQQRQTLMFSATLPTDIVKMANTMLKDPVKVSITPLSATVDAIEQKLYYVDKQNKMDLLIHLLSDSSIISALIFTRTKHGADKVVRQLRSANINGQAIHGDKSQGARQLALNNFKAGKLRVLVATDIAARGIDIDELSHVINFDLPNIAETYVHRIGRTGRAGLGGIAISFCDYDEKPLLAEIQKLIGKKIPEVSEHPYPLVNNFPSAKVSQGRPSHSRNVGSRSELSSRSESSPRSSSPAKIPSGKNDFTGEPSSYRRTPRPKWGPAPAKKDGRSRFPGKPSHKRTSAD